MILPLPATVIGEQYMRPSYVLGILQRWTFEDVGLGVQSTRRHKRAAAD